jgi:hypothetical protein
VRQQNTCWYQAGGKFSYTADPLQADPGEVRRVGLHDCAELGCGELHYSSMLTYNLALLQEYFGPDAAEGSPGGPRPARV